MILTMGFMNLTYFVWWPLGIAVLYTFAQNIKWEGSPGDACRKRYDSKVHNASFYKVPSTHYTKLVLAERQTTFSHIGHVIRAVAVWLHFAVSFGAAGLFVHCRHIARDTSVACWCFNFQLHLWCNTCDRHCARLLFSTARGCPSELHCAKMLQTGSRFACTHTFQGPLLFQHAASMLPQIAN